MQGVLSKLCLLLYFIYFGCTHKSSLGCGWTHRNIVNIETTEIKKGQAMLVRFPPHSNGQLRKLLSRIQMPYKMAKFDKQLLCQKYFFCMPLLHAHAH